MQFPDLYGRGISFILSLIPEGNLLWFLIKFTLLSDLSPMSSDSDANDYTTKKLKNTLQVQRGEGGGGRGLGEGRACDGDMTFFKNSPSYSLPKGKSFQSDAHKFVNFAAIESKIHQFLLKSDTAPIIR